MAAGAIGAVILAALPASASPGSAERTDRLPRPITLDRLGDESIVGASLALNQTGDEFFERSLRADLYGQLFAAPYGLYFALPVAKLSTTYDGETSLGGLELGLLHVSAIDPVTFVARGGLVLPTAGELEPEYTAHSVTLDVRLTDVALLFPDMTWIRLGFSAAARHGIAVGRVDIGLDVPLDASYDSPSVGWPAFIEPSELYRANLALGVDLREVAVLAELATVVNGRDTDHFERSHHTAALTARGRIARFEPFAAFILPVWSGAGAVDWVAMLGVEVAHR